MSRKCSECLESGRAHLPGCSYAPPTAEREAFIREHAVELVRQLEEQVRRQAKELAKLNQQRRAVGRAVVEEREECARLAASYEPLRPDLTLCQQLTVRDGIAAAIRARG